MDAAQGLLYVFFGLIALLALGALFAPIRFGLKLLINTIFGCFGLVIAGVFGGFLGIQISINVFTVLITGLFGFPGLLVVLGMYLLF